jgi:hypothetical protein
MPNTADTGLQLSPDKRAMVAGKRRATRYCTQMLVVLSTVQRR